MAKLVAGKLHDVEKERDEIISRAQVAEQTLEALQTELVHQKVNPIIFNIFEEENMVPS